MTSTRRQIIYLLLLHCVPLVCLQSIGKCGVDRSSKFDSVAASVTIIGNKNSTFPTTLSEANVWCSRTKESVKFMREFSKECLDNLSRQVANLIAFGMNKHQKKVCKNDETKAKTASRLRCLNVNYGKINQQMERFVDDYQRTIKLEQKQKLAGLCCSFHTFADRSRTEAKKVCSSENTQHFLDFIRAFSSDAMDLLCNTYGPETPACKNLVLPVKPADMNTTQSFLPPLLVSLSNL